MTVFYPNLSYNDVCFKGTILYNQQRSMVIHVDCLDRTTHRLATSPFFCRQYIFVTDFAIYHQNSPGVTKLFLCSTQH